MIRLGALVICFALSACAPERNNDGATSVRIGQAEPESLLVGIEVLVQEDFERLHGKRVGLIANQTSRAGDHHTADLLSAHPRVDLAALFGPEHGLRGDADAGSAVEDGLDDRTGVPVYSLYGERRAPDLEVLSELDILIFDIQDIGARFYTYIATMGLTMEAAADAGITFMVLDRPNPLGGVVVDGFVLESDFESFVGPYPIPIQHGMTVGELARMALGEDWVQAEGLDLQVVPVRGWQRHQLWPDLERPWIPTSPNIPDFTTALVYPGMCFLEATTLNEGRGTDEPFLVAGAPELDGVAWTTALSDGASGVTFSEARYTPVSMPGRAASPHHQDVGVSGIRLSVTDVRAVRPVALGMAVLAELVALKGPEVLAESWMGRLAGTGRLFQDLTSGRSASEIVGSWAAEVDSFRAARRSYLLYD